MWEGGATEWHWKEKETKNILILFSHPLSEPNENHFIFAVFVRRPTKKHVNNKLCKL